MTLIRQHAVHIACYGVCRDITLARAMINNNNVAKKFDPPPPETIERKMGEKNISMMDRCFSAVEAERFLLPLFLCCSSLTVM